MNIHRTSKILRFFCYVLFTTSLSFGIVQAATNTPLDWTQCLDAGIKHNPELQEAEIQLEETLGSIIIQRSDFLPKANATFLTLPPTLAFELRQPVYSHAFSPSLKAMRYGNSAAATKLHHFLFHTLF